MTAIEIIIYEFRLWTSVRATLGIHFILETDKNFLGHELEY